ncbi:hypothetical protein SVAN01_11512 [Stagonosporopsis vannaccii]|nr:hypothetical protein SVAN01_11512 [Stagonosporopsis vannaccii]
MCTLQKFKLVFFVPLSALQACKSAIFAAGAGRFPGSGGYTECCFTSKGTGQFRPGDSANPHVSHHFTPVKIGKVGTLEEVEEYRVEAICLGRDTAVEAVAALRKAHPYEEPAYEVYKMEDM